MTEAKNSKLPLFETAAMIIGELITSLIVCGVYLIIRKFDYTVALGALLGSLVTLANFLVLVITTGRAIDRAMEERGEGEMNDEEAAAFTAKHKMRLQAAIKISYILRTATIAGALVLAFLLGSVFDVIATLVPLLMLRPILTVASLIKARRGKA